MEARSCPLCDSGDGEVLLELEAAEFCRTNWTYSPDFRAILDLPERVIYPIRRCRACRFVYAGLLPDDVFLTTLYDRVIREDECIDGSEQRAGYARRLRYVADLLDLAPVGPVLDYGSGLGVTLRILRACRTDAVGLEPSAPRRDYSGDVVATLEEAAHRGPFAALVLDNVLEHLPDPARAIERIAPLSAPGAVAFISVPSYEQPFLDRQIAAQRRGTSIDMTLNPWEHLNYFTLEHLDALMGRGGFRRIAASRRSTPSIGLRATPTTLARLKNSAASALRLARFAVSGEVLPTVEHAYYRRH
jgi:SAM-dependent methyltransferase